MENRRHGAAQASKPFKKGRSNREGGEKPFEKRNQRSSYEPGTPAGGKYPEKNRSFESRDDRRFQSKKRYEPKGSSKQSSWKREQFPRIVSDMQITDGKHRGKYLKMSESPKIRPTARRIREGLFRLLFKQVRAGRFLDLCAGSGTIGLEAISRGALIGTFVERSAKMCSLIRENMESLGIKEGHGEIFEMEVVPFLKKMAKRKRFWDVVYYDPPYDTDYDDVLNYFKRGVAIRTGGILVIEHHSEMFFPEKIGVLRRWKVVVQDDTTVSFYERKG